MLRTTIQANETNIRDLFERSMVRPAGWLLRILQGARAAMQQLDVDSSYREIKLRQAETTLNAIRLQADIERARIENEENALSRKLTLLIGIVAAVVALAALVERNIGLTFGRTVLGLSLPDPVSFGGEVEIFLIRALLIALVSAPLVAAILWLSSERQK